MPAPRRNTGTRTPASRWGLRTLAACALLLHLQPVVAPLAAGAAHGWFHLSERLALANADWMSQQREGWREAVYTHAHGPGGEEHAHVVLVDMALAVAEAEHPVDGERARTHADVRLDLHLLPEVTLPELLPPPPLGEGEHARSPRSLHPTPPTTPPPKV